jgi:predicted component of type VI protein secretion system
MRIKDETARVLIDLPLLQAERLNERHYVEALSRGELDPYPDGTQATGSTERRGTLATNSGISTTQLSGGPLIGFDSALPDHIQAAMLRSLHNDDTSLRDFLAIFDRRLMALEVRTRKAAVLVATQDARGRDAASFLTRLLRMVKRSPHDTRHLKLLFPLLSRARTLEGLRDVLTWWTEREVSVAARFETMRPIDKDSLSSLTLNRDRGVALGKGALLGRFGRTTMGYIAVQIACINRHELDQLIKDTDGLAELRSVTSQYLRDPVPVTFFASIGRDCLEAPRLSARRSRADRLGAYNLLQPERCPNARAAIKLTKISA